MTTATASTLDLPAPAHVSTRGWTLNTYALETKYEFFKLLRTPHYSVPVLAFPVMFYLLFGLSLAGRTKDGIGVAQYLLASYSVFGVVTAGLFAFGAGVATERALGWLVLKRATPTLGGVHLPISTWLKLLAVITLGSVPFCMIGLLVAFIVPPAGAPGIMNLINLPLAFAGGLWMPVEMLPKMFRAITPVIPQYHLGQLALAAVGAAPTSAVTGHTFALGITALLFGAASWVAWRRSDASA
jgi:ABC-2 type transport system permease protein